MVTKFGVLDNNQQCEYTDDNPMSFVNPYGYMDMNIVNGMVILM